MRNINQAGLDLIKKYEGLRLFAYKDGGGVLTIGYGHTGKDVNSNTQITSERAEMLLEQDLAWACKAVENSVIVPLTDNQFAALVALTFNIGEAALKGSTLLKKLNSGNYREAPDQFKRWNKDNGVTVMGLGNRRKAEAELWGTA